MFIFKSDFLIKRYLKLREGAIIFLHSENIGVDFIIIAMRLINLARKDAPDTEKGMRVGND